MNKLQIRDDTVEWGLQIFYVISGYCPQYCQLCEVLLKCKICQSGYFKYKENTCISGCDQPYQKLMVLIDKILMMKHHTLIIQLIIFQIILSILITNEFIILWFNIWRAYIWAQAKFYRIHEIIDPHHSITIPFYILYGPAFPSDGLFIYKNENNPPISKSSNSFQGSNNLGGKYDQVYESTNHDSNTFTISWECFGSNNEQFKLIVDFIIITLLFISASSIVYNNLIRVHVNNGIVIMIQLQLNSLKKKVQVTNIMIRILFDVQIVQYLVQHVSQIDCQTCQSTFIQTKLGCILNSINWKIQINILIVHLNVINVQIQATVQIVKSASITKNFLNHAPMLNLLQSNN
ncbi:unnamed protein product [Paramecium primaurelia]|uniref:Transmembrane protein n=1 Tax=Paramecium primaurelia TaxID=5886 RepID=A0A8S1QPT7_PARPR|nr:unnamed protein product [Paramecium primaurelia]